MADQSLPIFLATIANGASLSGAVDLGPELRAALIQMPGDWAAADLTFQASVDGTTFWNLHVDSSDTEVTVQAGEDRTIVLPKTVFEGIRHLKIRSGTAGSAVNQGAARTLTIGVAAL
jgi:hypothetical protein